MSSQQKNKGLVILISVYFISLILLSCSGNSINSSEPLALTGFSWGSIEIEGTINPDGKSS